MRQLTNSINSRCIAKLLATSSQANRLFDVSSIALGQGSNTVLSNSSFYPLLSIRFPIIKIFITTKCQKYIFHFYGFKMQFKSTIIILYNDILF